jgi:hypothetical protein
MSVLAHFADANPGLEPRRKGAMNWTLDGSQRNAVGPERNITGAQELKTATMSFVAVGLFVIAAVAELMRGEVA